MTRNRSLETHSGWGAYVSERRRIRDDNRISNLRLATNAENQRNAGVRRDNRLGVKGVHKAGNRYRALISVNGEQRHLGYYQSIDAAREAYNRASAELHGQFSRLA